MLVLSYEFDNIIFCKLLNIYEAISYYGAQAFSIHSPRASPPIHLITCSSPHITSKVGEILHPPGHWLLTLGDDFITHGLLFKIDIYQILGCSSHGLNSQEIILSHQLISASLHGSSFHHAVFIFLIQLSTLFFFQRGRFLQT